MAGLPVQGATGGFSAQLARLVAAVTVAGLPGQRPTATPERKPLFDLSEADMPRGPQGTNNWEPLADLPHPDFRAGAPAAMPLENGEDPNDLTTAAPPDHSTVGDGAMFGDGRRADADADTPSGIGDAAQPVPAGLAGVMPAEAFRFHIDEISETKIAGWVIREDDPSRHCLVAVRAGERIIARTVASEFRGDLATAGVGDGCHAFDIPTPRLLLDGGEHLIDIIEQDTGVSLTNGPVLWRVAPVAGWPPFREAAEPLAARLLRPGQPGGSAEADLRAWANGPTSEPPMRTATKRMSQRAPVVAGTRILFDISDLVYYIGHHPNLTGIQRVQSSIVLAILRDELLPRSNLVFLSFNTKTRNWVSIPTGFLLTVLQELFLPERLRPVSFSAEEARYGVLPGARAFAGTGVLDQGNPSVLCLLGAAWIQEDYFNRVLALKRHFGTRFALTVHDLIPIYARETCDQDTARVFEEFIGRALRHADHVLSVSENTARDIRRYVPALKLPEPAITVTRNGSSFAEFLPNDSTSSEVRPSEVPQRFVLFVATIEGRKNHRLMFDIWRRMVEDGDDPPHLVCVGRLGWKATGFISALIETDHLDGRIQVLQDVSDTDLQMLYRRCLFTVCPTLYEGWGLPIGESLAMGKICVSSNRSSVPEVAGDFGVYIDIDDFDQSLAAIRELIADAAARKRLEAKIRRGYKPVSWRSVAERVVEACLSAAQAKWPQPYPYTAVPYASEISFGRLDRDVDGTGEFLLTRIAAARKGAFLGDPLDDRAFIRGEEARSSGDWAQPEAWGTWACYGGGEITLALPPDGSAFCNAILRLRASGPAAEQPIRILANGELAWEGSLGGRSRDIALRIRRRVPAAEFWRLRLRAQIDLTPGLHRQIAAIDSRIPTIGFERLIVVAENDLKTRLDILYRLSL